MTLGCHQIQALVMRMQTAFLDTPGLTLSLKDAERRFGVDEVRCDAVLTALVDANVLARTREGAYVRFFPRLVRSRTDASVRPRHRKPAAGSAGAIAHISHSKHAA